MTKEEWDSKQNASKKQFKYMPTGTPGQVKKVEVMDDEENGETASDDETAELSPETKANWNKYLSWLDQKKMKGKPELDKGGLGNQLFNQYLKENPESGLNTSVIPKIRKAYLDMRNQGLEDIKSGKIGLEKGSTPDNFMKHILLNEQSGDPNYVGQHLTQTMFPGAVMKLEDKSGKVIAEKSAAIRGKGLEASKSLGKQL